MNISLRSNIFLMPFSWLLNDFFKTLSRLYLDFIITFLWLIYYLLSIFPWLWHDCLITFSWLFQNFSWLSLDLSLVTSTWLANECLMKLLWFSFDFIMTFYGPSPDFLTFSFLFYDFVWIFFQKFQGFFITFSRISHDCILTLSWLYHELIITLSWLPHEFLMTFS